MTMPKTQTHYQADIEAQLRDGAHVVLYGPRGSGKSTLVAGIQHSLQARGMPCGLASHMNSLADLTQALARAYPDVDVSALSQRRARSKLRTASDCRRGVLLLDHVTTVGTAAIGFMRRLRGGIAGVLLVVDVEVERERQRLRAQQLGTCTLRMPLAANPLLRRLLITESERTGAALPGPRELRYLVQAARGRPGWIMQCAQRLRQPDYWHAGALYTHVLCSDVEIALRGVTVTAGRFAAAKAPDSSRPYLHDRVSKS